MTEKTETIKAATTVGTQPQAFDYLVVIDFEATCDEGPDAIVTRQNQEIIEFPWVVIDTKSRQIVDQQQHYVQPVLTRGVTAFCTKLTGIDSAKVLNAPLLAKVLEMFDKYCAANFDAKEKSYCILTDGDWDCKIQLAGELHKKHLRPAHAHYLSFFNLKPHFAAHYKSSDRKSLKQMTEMLDLKLVGHHHCGLDDCLSIAAIVLRMINDGYIFSTPTVIPANYDPNKDPSIHDYSQHRNGRAANLFAVPKESTEVLRLRGLPWSATGKDVSAFFSGCDIADDGITFLLNELGRPDGTAFVRFVSNTMAEEALKKDHAQMGSRYVDIFRATLQQFTSARELSSQYATAHGRGRGRGRARRRDN